MPRAGVKNDGLLFIRGQQALSDRPAALLAFARGLCRVAAGEPPELEGQTAPAPRAFAEGKQLFGGDDVWLPGHPSHRRDCHLITPPCNFIRCFNRDKQGVS